MRSAYSMHCSLFAHMIEREAEREEKIANNEMPAAPRRVRQKMLC